jgi:hypothetical protein
MYGTEYNSIVVLVVGIPVGARDFMVAVVVVVAAVDLVSPSNRAVLVVVDESE